MTCTIFHGTPYFPQVNKKSQNFFCNSSDFFNLLINNYFEGKKRICPNIPRDIIHDKSLSVESKIINKIFLDPVGYICKACHCFYFTSTKLLPMLERMQKLENMIQSVRELIEQLQNHPDQEFLDEVGFREFMKISPRKSAMYRQRRLISYIKIGGKLYYRKSAILEFMGKYEIPAIDSNLKIKL